MTTRNFRVHNGISVGDIVISASANTITGLTTSAPSSDGDVSNKKYVDDAVAAIPTSTNLSKGINFKGQACVNTTSATPEGSDYQTGALIWSTVSNTLFVKG